MIEVVVFVLLYSICCSIIEDRVCVFGVCFCCDISTEVPHRIFVNVEGALTAETLDGLVLRADKKVIILDPTTYDEPLVVVAKGKFAVSVLDPSIEVQQNGWFEHSQKSSNHA